KQELAIIEEMGKFDTGEMFFEKDLGEENIEW
ncbi:AbrB family transcriptional regulator, partial [Listeria monocytogenes]|nr:AbrB family transcriptional regulator [Listeria monocytogenes]